MSDDRPGFYSLNQVEPVLAEIRGGPMDETLRIAEAIAFLEARGYRVERPEPTGVSIVQWGADRSSHAHTRRHHRAECRCRSCMWNGSQECRGGCDVCDRDR